MGESRGGGLFMAAVLGMLSGKSTDEIVDELIDPKCFKCGKSFPINDLIHISAGNICAPCVLDSSVKNGEAHDTRD